MKKSSKWMLIVGGALVFAGVLMAGVSIAAGARTAISVGTGGIRISETQVKDFGKGEVIRDQQTTEEFHSIDIKVGVSNIRLIPSDHFGYEYQINRADSSLVVTNDLGVLSVKTENRVGFNLNLFGMLNRQENYLNIYYPEGTQFRFAKISNDLGDLRVESLHAEQVDFSLDLGAGHYENITAKSVKISHSNGTFEAQNLEADTIEIDNDLGSSALSAVKAGKLVFEGDLGRLDLKDSVIASTDISSSLGEVNVVNLESDGIEIDADSGSVTLTGTLRGRTKIQADLGSVAVSSTLEKNDYNYDIHSDLGSVTFNGKKQDGLTFDTGAANDLVISVDSGSIRINIGE